MPAPSRAFDRLDEKVRRWIWEQKWDQLRDVQEEAIDPILSGSTDLILMAATAAGKTEAAFLPICSRLATNPNGSVRALYLGPLKALINDQFERLERLCEHLEIPVHRWHGDVSSSDKKALLDRPGGVLLITPESLEALYVLRGTHIGRLFRQLDYVVIDEFHAFIGNERGKQIQSLLHRLEIELGRTVPRIALSATLGDIALAASFLRPGKGETVKNIESKDGNRELRMQLRGYRRTAPRLGPSAAGKAEAAGHTVELEDVVDGDQLAVSEHLFNTLRGTDNLIFANARTLVEVYADLLRRMSERLRVPNEFFPHHGNLSKELREDVERLLKDKSRPLNAVCTATLELGIDIGSVRSIAQIGTPPSVAAMRQRLGRSGRKTGEASVLRLYAIEEETTADTPLQDAIRPGLVQTIAMVRLLLARWYEPPLAGALHLSTLVQQVLSTIAQHGGVTAKDAWRSLCKTGPFQDVDARMFAELLRNLGTHDLVSQASDGTLLLGTVGERMVNHYSFYTAFTTPEEYRLVTQGRTLGTLPIDYPIAQGQLLIFAGRRWRVASVDAEHRVVDLVAAPGGRPPLFRGSGISVHDRVRQEMLAVYRSGDIPAFLDVAARDLLAEARSEFARAGLVERQIVARGDDSILFPWMGSRITNTILLQLRDRGINVCLDDVALTVDNHTPEQLRDLLQSLVAEGPADGPAFAAMAADRLLEKYDQFLPERLLCLDYASRRLDPLGAWHTLRRIVEATPRPPRPPRREKAGPPPVVFWRTVDLVNAIADLPTDATLPARTVLVPNERVAHGLRREIVRAGQSGLLMGTRFITPTAAAMEVLAAAGVTFKHGEETFRTLRLRRLLRDTPLRHFPRELLTRTRGWDNAFADAFSDLEEAELCTADLTSNSSAQLEDIRNLWQAANDEAGTSWTRARILREAALQLEASAKVWPFSSSVLAVADGHIGSALARFIQSVPGVQIALRAGRPVREQYLSRVEALFGTGAADAIRSSSPKREANTERDILAAYLFEPPSLLADECRSLSNGPDGTVDLEEHPGLDSEIEGAVTWVARQIIERHTPLEDIGILMPTLDPVASFVVDRLRRLPWPNESIPVCVAEGLPATGLVEVTRILGTIQALRSGLSAENFGDLLPAIRLLDADRRHLTRGAALDLTYSLGTAGGNSASLSDGLDWAARLTQRIAVLNAQLERARMSEDDPEKQRTSRSVRDLERLAADASAIRPGVEALVSLLRLVVEGRTVGELWDALRSFCDEWLLLPTDGPPVLGLLSDALATLLDGLHGYPPVADEALEIIETALRELRVPTARFGEPAVYVGTISGAVGIPFQAVRVIGLCEGSVPGVPRENPVLPELLWTQLPSIAGSLAADRILSQLHALDSVVRDTRGTLALSAPRMAPEQGEREPSSIFVEVAAALGRPNSTTGERQDPVPTRNTLQRDAFRPARAAAVAFRISTPLLASAWMERAAAERCVPESWRADGALSLERISAWSNSSGWTGLDGVLDDVVDAPGMTPGRPISASRLRTLLECPHRFLFESILGWREPPAPPSMREIDQLAYGTLFHRALETFFAEHGIAFCERRETLQDWHVVADTLANRAFDEFCGEYPLMGETIRQQQRDRLRRDVTIFLTRDWNSPAPRKFVAVERGFGHDRPIAITVGDVVLYLRGYIDRIDVEDGRTLVRDLKTGRAHPRRGKDAEPNPVRDMQLAIYALVARQLAVSWSVPQEVAAAYAYVDPRADFERAFRSDFDLLESQAKGWLAAAAGLLRAGQYPRTPDPKDCEYCPFEPVCGLRPHDRAASLLTTAEEPLVSFRQLKAATT